MELSDWVEKSRPMDQEESSPSVAYFEKHQLHKIYIAILLIAHRQTSSSSSSSYR